MIAELTTEPTMRDITTQPVDDGMVMCGDNSSLPAPAHPRRADDPIVDDALAPRFDLVTIEHPPRVGSVIAAGSASVDTVLNIMYGYARDVGFTLRFNSDRPGPLGNNRIRTACQHSGSAPASVKHVDPCKHRNKRSKRVGCPFGVTLKRMSTRPPNSEGTCSAFFDDSSAWVVIRAEGLDHGPCEGLDNRCHPLHPFKQDVLPDHALPHEVREKIKHYVADGDCSMRQVGNLLAIDFPGMVLEEQQVRNAVTASRPTDLRNGQCRRLLEALLTDQHTSDPDLMIKTLLDNDDRLKGVLWVTGEQRQAWLQSGADVVIHDNTYNLDELGYKVGVFNGISKEGKTIALGQCFIIDEESTSYEWQFRSWLECQDNLAPLLVITDSDPAVACVVGIIFPDAIHMWCLWHILQNVFKNCRGTVGGRIGQLLADLICVAQTITEKAFLAR